MVDRRFWIADSRRAEFENAFGPGGAWSKLLCQANGYLLTEAWCESPEARQYRVRDFWNWHRSFEVFREKFRSEFERFEQWLRSEELIKREQFLGAYYERFGGESGEGLVLS